MRLVIGIWREKRIIPMGCSIMICGCRCNSSTTEGAFSCQLYRSSSRRRKKERKKENDGTELNCSFSMLLFLSFSFSLPLLFEEREREIGEEKKIDSNDNDEAKTRMDGLS